MQKQRNGHIAMHWTSLLWLIYLFCLYYFPSIFFCLQYRMKFYKTLACHDFIQLWYEQERCRSGCGAIFPEECITWSTKNFNYSPYSSLHHVNELQSIFHIISVPYKCRISVVLTGAHLCTVKCKTANDISSLEYCDKYINRSPVSAPG